MNVELTIIWVNTVIGKFSFSHPLVAWDSYEAHITDEVRATLKASTVDDVIVAGGCTKYIQGPTIVWNKAFKAFITNKYDEWLSTGVHEYAGAGNLKPVPRLKIVAWYRILEFNSKGNGCPVFHLEV